MIKLGNKVKDSISGFEGIVTSITEYLYGCRRMEVCPNKLDKEGKTTKAGFYDEYQLTIVGKKTKTWGNMRPAFLPTGGDHRDAPPAKSIPVR